MNELIWLFFGVLLAGLANWLFRFWRISVDRNRRTTAKIILTKYGLTAQLYFPSLGEDRADLQEALDTFALTGHIITNAHGEVVGGVCSVNKRTPHLRLVVSNNVGPAE